MDSTLNEREQASGAGAVLTLIRNVSGKLSFDTEEARAFLQHRVALYGLIAIGSFFFFFFVYRVVFALSLDTAAQIQGVHYLVASAALVAPWMILRTGTYSVRFIRAVEFSSIALGCIGLRRQVRNAQQLGQYRLEEKLGEGGMGVVYRASHSFLRRPTAVKLLPSEKAGEVNIRRFEKEVQLTARLTHPNTVTIFDYGHTPNGVFYYAMEYIDGLTLHDLVVRSGALPQGRVVHLMRQAAAALVQAHGIGLVHRDIKPANIMVHLLHDHGGVGDFVKVLDFGLVKEIRQEGGIDLTNEATISGTPQYLSPEAIRAPDTIDPRGDIYALGAVAYFLLTGTHVFSGRTTVEVCGHHLHAEPEPPSKRVNQPLSQDLEQLVLACLAKDPADRPQSALEFEHQLASCRGVPEWTTEDAIDWWRQRGTSPETTSTDLGLVTTVGVDSARMAS